MKSVSLIVLFIALLTSSLAWGQGFRVEDLVPEPWGASSSSSTPTPIVELLPIEFPLRVSTFWWGESITSAKSRCIEFQKRKTHNFFGCERTDTLYILGFNRLKRLDTIGFWVTPSDYARCETEVTVLISGGPQVNEDYTRIRVGVRSEDKGVEIWRVIFGSIQDDKVKRIGMIECRQVFEGCLAPEGCAPMIWLHK